MDTIKEFSRKDIKIGLVGFNAFKILLIDKNSQPVPYQDHELIVRFAKLPLTFPRYTQAGIKDAYSFG